jgi:hypothetical protein
MPGAGSPPVKMGSGATFTDYSTIIDSAVLIVKARKELTRLGK